MKFKFVKMNEFVSRGDDNKKAKIHVHKGNLKDISFRTTWPISPNLTQSKPR